MKYLTFFALLIALLASCSRDFDEAQYQSIDLDNFYSSYVDNSNITRIDAWQKLSVEQKYSIWKQRFNALEKNPSLIPEQKDLISDLNSYMSLENYIEENKLVTYYDFMVPKLSKVFTQRELHFLFETINPYIDNHKTSLKVLAKRKGNSLSLKVDTTDPGENIPSCDCSWMCTVIIECGASKCHPTNNGCRLFWLGQCTGLC